MEHNNKQPDSRQTLQNLQNSTGILLDSLTEEQVNELLARLNQLKKQRAEAKAVECAQTDTVTADIRPPIPKPQVSGEDAEHAAVLRKADAAAQALDAAQTSAQPAEAEADNPAIIYPDPACFEELGEAPNHEIDYDPSMSTYSGEDTDDVPTKAYSAPISDYDTRPLSSDDMDEATIAVYRGLVLRRRRQRRLLIALITAFGLLLLTIAVFAGYMTLYRPTLDDDTPSFWGEESTAPDDSGADSISDSAAVSDDIITPVVDDGYARREDVYNFLVLGVDRAANLSDVIMVVSYDVKNGEIHVLSLPRDTYINVGASYHKLNAYFSAAYNRSAKKGTERYRDAIDSMSAFIERGLCIKLDRYICMDTAGFREIIDAIGGVDMEVPFDMDYEDPEQDLYIHLKAGYQHLDGAKAEQFVRFRSAYLEGDIGRISAQRLFLTALANQVKTKLDVSTAVSIAKTAIDYVTTDLTVAEIGYFVKSALSVNMDSISFTTLPGGGVINPDTGASYYVMYAETVRSIVNDRFNVYTREITREVFLSNSTKFTSDASYISAVFLAEIPDSGKITAGELESGAPDIPRR